MRAHSGVCMPMYVYRVIIVIGIIAPPEVVCIVCVPFVCVSNMCVVCVAVCACVWEVIAPPARYCNQAVCSVGSRAC